MNNVYLILGASSDMGAALIKLVDARESGAAFIAHYHSEKAALDEIAPKGETTHGNTLVCARADLSDAADTARFIAEVRDLCGEGGAPTHIVHIAAEAFRYTKLKEFSRERFIRALDIQVCSFIEVMKAFLPIMAKRRAHNKVAAVISSYVTGAPPRFMLDYIVMKYALLGAVKALAADYTGKGVNINAVSPSMVETKFLRGVDSRIVAITAQKSPEGRNATVDDIAGGIAFLLSDAANYIHGQNIVMNNGGSEV